MRRPLTIALLFVVTAVWLAANQAPPSSRAPAQLTQDQLFQRTKVWNVELRFTAEEWEAIRPKHGQPTGRSRLSGAEWLQGAPGERNGWAATRGIHFDYGHADLVFDGVTFKNVAVRVKGNGSYNGPSDLAKNSYKVDLNKYVKGQKVAGVSTLNFHNTTQDPGFMTESMALRLFRDAGIPSSRTAYLRLTITVIGRFDQSYRGLYQLVENVDDNFLTARFGTAAGPLLKPVSVQPFSVLGETWNAAYTQTYDPKDDLTPADEARVIDLCKLVQTAPDAVFNARIGSFVDVDAFARFMAVTMWMNNYDSILRNGQNYYVYIPASTGKMIWIPWDQDSALGQFTQQPPGRAAVGNIYEWPFRFRFLDRLMAVDRFRAAYLGYLRQFNETIFKPERFPPQVEELAAATRPFVPEERLASQAPLVGVGSLQNQYEQRVSGRAGVLPFIFARWESVDRQLANPPQGR